MLFLKIKGAKELVYKIDVSPKLHYNTKTNIKRAGSEKHKEFIHITKEGGTMVNDIVVIRANKIANHRELNVISHCRLHCFF